MKKEGIQFIYQLYIYVAWLLSAHIIYNPLSDKNMKAIPLIRERDYFLNLHLPYLYYKFKNSTETSVCIDKCSIKRT